MNQPTNPLRKWNEKLTKYLQDNKLLFLFGSLALQELFEGTTIINAEFIRNVNTITVKTEKRSWEVVFPNSIQYVIIRDSISPDSKNLNQFVWFISRNYEETYNEERYTKDDLLILKKLFKEGVFYAKSFALTEEIIKWETYNHQNKALLEREQ